MPEWTEQLRTRLASLRLNPAREAEIVEELSQHLDQRYEELRRTGANETDAYRQASEELLDANALAARMQSLRQAHVPAPIPLGAAPGFLLKDLWLDLRYAWRTLRKQPGFAAAAILTLALGIGANSAIFALADATLLRPLPLPTADRLMMMWERTDTSARGPVSPLNMIDWNDRSRAFERVGGFVPGVGSMVMAGADGTAETVPRQWVTAGIFDALGVKPIVGRTFLPSDDSQRANVVVLSETFWRSRFKGDPSVVGQTTRLDGIQFTIVGVVSDEAQLIGRTSMWALRWIPPDPRLRGSYGLRVVGRMKPGVTLEAAEADIARVAEGLAKEFPATNKGRSVALEPMRDAVIGGDLRLTSILFLGVVGFVLLICCANVANLLLARATVRMRELAIRAALGAGRRRMVRQLLAESLLLSVIGGILGAGFGALILWIAPSVIPPGLMPQTVTLNFDGRIAAFCAAMAILIGLLFGLVPALQATGLSLANIMGSSSRATTGRGTGLRGLLVIGEISTAVLLLFGSGLLLRTLIALETVDRGYRNDQVLTMMVDPLGDQYPTPAALLQFFDSIEQEVRALPGVRSVAWASMLPLRPPEDDPPFFEIVGDPPVEESQRPTADYNIVSAQYFQTVELPLVAGRSFSEGDGPASVPTAIVSEGFVRRYLRGRSPIGVRVGFRRGAPPAPLAVREIVGVVRQVKERPDETEDRPQIYVPMAQRPTDDIYLLVGPKSGKAEALAPSVRAAIARVDTAQLVSIRDVMTLSDIAWGATGRHRFRAILVTTFAGLALLLAMVGVFGLLAYTVQQRVRDFGVRRALGASTGEVLRLVVGNALRLVLTGAVIGLILSAILLRYVSTMLFGVQPLDLITFVSVIAVLALTAAASVLGPAWRAAHVDPVVALRSE